MAQLNPGKFTHQLDIKEMAHAKFHINWRPGSMSTKISKLHIHGVTQVVTPYFKNSKPSIHI
jgi:hypothetical protein